MFPLFMVMVAAWELTDGQVDILTAAVSGIFLVLVAMVPVWFKTKGEATAAKVAAQQNGYVKTEEFETFVTLVTDQFERVHMRLDEIAKRGTNVL